MTDADVTTAPFADAGTAAPFLAAIHDRPDDPGPRGVFADFLAERGEFTWPVVLGHVLRWPDSDPMRLLVADWCEQNGQRERAEFVRTQCELAGLPGCSFAADQGGRACEQTARPHSVSCRWCELRGREGELLTAERALAWGPHRALWADGLQSPFCGMPGNDELVAAGHVGVEFRRGFVEAVICNAADFLAHADALFAFTPLRRWRATTLPPAHVPEFNALRAWKRPLEWGGDIRDSFAAEFPGLEVELPVADPRPTPDELRRAVERIERHAGRTVGTPVAYTYPPPAADDDAAIALIGRAVGDHLDARRAELAAAFRAAFTARQGALPDRWELVTGAGSTLYHQCDRAEGRVVAHPVRLETYWFEVPDPELVGVGPAGTSFDPPSRGRRVEHFVVEASACPHCRVGFYRSVPADSWV